MVFTELDKFEDMIFFVNNITSTLNHYLQKEEIEDVFIEKVICNDSKFNLQLCINYKYYLIIRGDNSIIARWTIETQYGEPLYWGTIMNHDEIDSNMLKIYGAIKVIKDE